MLANAWLSRVDCGRKALAMVAFRRFALAFALATAAKIVAISHLRISRDHLDYHLIGPSHVTSRRAGRSMAGPGAPSGHIASSSNRKITILSGRAAATPADRRFGSAVGYVVGGAAVLWGSVVQVWGCGRVVGLAGRQAASGVKVTDQPRARSSLVSLAVRRPVSMRLA